MIIVSMLLSDPKYEIHFYSGQKSVNYLSDMICSWLIQRSGPPKIFVCMVPDTEVKDILNLGPNI